jgi:2-oxo-3-hexenedioate decarboxylase/2-keto-4-pentenoate hydratase
LAPESTQRAATLLSAGRLRRERLHELPAEWRPGDEAAAYRVQDELHLILTNEGFGNIAGYKIGCTTPVMQAFLGIANPCAGGVFAATVQHEAGHFRFSDFLHGGVECEIAVRLGADLPAAEAPFGRDRVAAAVDACMAAIEIVDDRYVNYRGLDTPTLIADDFFNAGCVLGRPVTDWRTLDIPQLVGVTRINGVEVGRGRGADVMGHPLEALRWLANQLAGRGASLQRGQFVLTGSVVETRWINPDDEVVISIPELGEVRARFDK